MGSILSRNLLSLFFLILAFSNNVVFEANRSRNLEEANEKIGNRDGWPDNLVRFDAGSARTESGQDSQ